MKHPSFLILGALALGLYIGSLRADRKLVYALAKEILDQNEARRSTYRTYRDFNTSYGKDKK